MWDCECGTAGNFSWRDRCRRCGKLAPHGRILVEESSWNSRARANHMRDSGLDVCEWLTNRNGGWTSALDPHILTMVRYGDWICIYCGKHQFARNKQCRNCGSGFAAPATNISLTTNAGAGDVTVSNDGCVISHLTGVGNATIKSSPEAALCVVCLDGPRNIMLVHGRTGHTCVCAGCADKLRGRCPMCRQPIDAAIRNFQ